MTVGGNGQHWIICFQSEERMLTYAFFHIVLHNFSGLRMSIVLKLSDCVTRVSKPTTVESTTQLIQLYEGKF